MDRVTFERMLYEGMKDRLKEHEEEDDMGTMSILSQKGDETVRWDKDDPASVENARKKFLEFLAERKGMAIRMNEDGQKGDKMTDFDPDAERVVLMPLVVGG